MSENIEKAIEEDDWPKARRLINYALRREPESHWLLTRLGLTYYEQYDYKQALHYSEKALNIAPRCPLVLWDYAGCLDMLDRKKEAISIFRRLIRRGIDKIAYDECGEGKAWAKGLIADCHYRIAHCQRDLGQVKSAIKELDIHLGLRGPECRSIYSLKKVRQELQHLNGKIAQQRP